MERGQLIETSTVFSFISEDVLKLLASCPELTKCEGTLVYKIEPQEHRIPDFRVDVDIGSSKSNRSPLRIQNQTSLRRTRPLSPD